MSIELYGFRKARDDEPLGIIDRVDRLYKVPLPDEVRQILDNPEMLSEPHVEDHGLEVILGTITFEPLQKRKKKFYFF